MPRTAPARLPSAEREGARAVYLPSCLTRTIGAAGGGRAGLPETFARVARRAGHPLWTPRDCLGTCCGMPFASKGFPEEAAAMGNRLVEGLWRWTEEGRLPAVMDATSCVQALRSGSIPLPREAGERLARIELLDAVELAHDRLLPSLELRPVVAAVAVHPTCSARKLGIAAELEAIVRACATRAVVPLALECCATAGDRGMVYPELSAAALAPEAAELVAAGCTRGVASNLTCEIGLSEATGIPFGSFLDLLDEASRRHPS